MGRSDRLISFSPPPEKELRAVVVSLLALLPEIPPTAVPSMCGYIFNECLDMVYWIR